MVDDRRVGLVIRALRRRRGWRQSDLALAAKLSESVIGRAEAGHFDSMSLRVRQITSALDVRLDLSPRWRGGELDRLLDSQHAANVVITAEELVADNWSPMQEVTYAIYGERGSLDLLGLKEAEACAAVMEIKSTITSWEETQRRFDEKCRLLPRIVYERWGWRPRTIGRILVVADSMTNRRRVEQLGTVVAQAYPARTRQVRKWLRDPIGSLAGIWFLSIPHGRGLSEARGGPDRVRRPHRPPTPTVA